MRDFKFPYRNRKIKCSSLPKHTFCSYDFNIEQTVETTWGAFLHAEREFDEHALKYGADQSRIISDCERRINELRAQCRNELRELLKQEPTIDAAISHLFQK